MAAKKKAAKKAVKKTTKKKAVKKATKKKKKQSFLNSLSTFDYNQRWIRLAVAIVIKQKPANMRVFALWRGPL